MVCSPPGSSLHGVSQAGILEWVAISSSRGSSWPRDQTCVSFIGRGILYHWATREGHIRQAQSYVSVPISQFTRLPLPLSVHTFVLYICCLRFCFANRLICTRCVNIWYLFYLSDLLCMTVSRSRMYCFLKFTFVFTEVIWYLSPGLNVLLVWQWKSFSRVRLFVTPWTVACHTSLFMEFSRPEYWNR